MHFPLLAFASESLDTNQIVVFCFVAVIVAIGSFSRWQRQKLWHETARVAIEKGQPMPPAFTLGRWGWMGRGWALYRGAIWIAVGIGMLLVKSTGAQKWAPLPICIGVALLVVGIVSYFWGNRNTGAPTPNDQR
jgi:hypothetical protein